MQRYIGFFEEFTFFQTDNPIEEIWSLFLRFSDINYLQKAWKDRSDGEYIYVATCIKQAHEYYQASRDLTLNTKPLLLYYSFINLTKATLYLINDKRPSDYHGLCKENLTKEITSANDLLDFSAEISNGVFKALADSIGAKYNKNQRFTMDDFFSNTIELNNDYHMYFGKNRNIIAAKVDVFQNGDIHIIFNKNDVNLNDLVSDRLIMFFGEFTHEKKESTLIFKKNIDKSKLDNTEFNKQVTALLKNYFSFSIFSSSPYLININDDARKMPSVLAYFGIMFILSSIVRYKPEKIYKLLNEKNTSVNWMLNKICSTAARVYPNLLLNLLSSQPMKFSSSSM